MLFGAGAQRLTPILGLNIVFFVTNRCQCRICFHGFANNYVTELNKGLLFGHRIARFMLFPSCCLRISLTLIYFELLIAKFE